MGTAALTAVSRRLILPSGTSDCQHSAFAIVNVAMRMKANAGEPVSIEPSLLSYLRPVERRVLHETVLVQLLLAIRNGQVRPGERIREVEIADRLGLSRGTVREALLRLEQDGVVVSQPHRGTYIAPITSEDASELFSLRRLLEAFAIELAIPRLSEEALRDLQATARAMVEAASRGDHAEHRLLDLQFHEQICLLSGHRHLYKTWAALVLKLWLIYFDRGGKLVEDSVLRATAHLELIAIFRRGDVAEARAWIERHIDRRASVVAQLMREKAGSYESQTSNGASERPPEPT